MEWIAGPVKALVALVIAALASASYVGISATAIDIDGEGITYSLYRTLTVTNRGPERARFTVAGNTPWMSVGREYQPVATSIQIAPGESVNFIIEVHPRLVPDQGASNVITVTAADPRDGTALDASTVGVRVIKKRQPVASVTPSVSLLPLVRPTIVPPRPSAPSVRPSIPPVRTVRPLPSRSVRPSQSPASAPARGESLWERLKRWF